MVDDDMGTFFRDWKEQKRKLRSRHGAECPECKKNRPKTNASILLPGQKCKVDGYVDPRPRLPRDKKSGTILL